MGEESGGTPRRWPWVVSGALIIVAVALLMGAVRGDGDQQVDMGSDPAGDRAILRPGEEIADGFVVAEGTTVAGGAFPTIDSVYDDGSSERAWTADLVADRDLVAAVERYVDQARALGFEGIGAAEQACELEPAIRGSNPDGSAAPPPPADAPPSYLRCGASGERVRDGHVEGFSISGERSYASEYPSDELTLGFARYPVELDDPATWEPQVREQGADGTLDWTGASEVEQPPVTSAVDTAPLARCGTVLDPIEGTRFLNASVSCSYHNSVVFEITGDPGTVYDEATRQLRELEGYNESSYWSSDIEFDGRAGRMAAVWGDDSTTTQITVLDGAADRPALLRVYFLNGT